jgi:hypothetical protein
MLEKSWADPTFVAPDPYGSDVRAVHDALATARLRVVDGFAERMIVHDRHQIAGTFDLPVEDETGEKFVADIKTGSSLLGALAFAVQLSIYANADALYNQGAAKDGSEDTREPMPEVSKLHGVIIHVQPASGHCDLHWLDLAIGAEALELAIAVREMRKAKTLSPFVVEVDVVEPGAAQGDAAHAACGEGLEHRGREVVVDEGADGLRPGRERGGTHVQPGVERQCVDPRFAQSAVQRFGLVGTVRIHGDAHGSAPFPSMPHPDAGPRPGV